jgi:hypothetical protein
MDILVKDIRDDKRPPRPTDSNQNRRLQDPVWDTIATCWNKKPEQRYKLSVMYHVFSSLSPQDAQNAKSDKPERRVKLIPRITSLFQFLRDSEPEIERLVNEMDKVRPSTFLPSHG